MLLETILITGGGLPLGFILGRVRLTGTNSEPLSATADAVNPLEIDPRVRWDHVAALEVSIYGTVFHHGFGVRCQCDSCKPRKDKLVNTGYKMLVPKTNREWLQEANEILFRTGYRSQSLNYRLLVNYIQRSHHVSLFTPSDVKALQTVLSYIGEPPQS